MPWEGEVGRGMPHCLPPLPPPLPPPHYAFPACLASQDMLPEEQKHRPRNTGIGRQGMLCMTQENKAMLHGGSRAPESPLVSTSCMVHIGFYRHARS